VTISDGEVVYRVRSAEKADQGRYGVTLTNSKGQSTSSLNVNVKGQFYLNIYIIVVI